MFVIFALLLKEAIFGFWSFPRFSLILNTDMKDGSWSFVVSFVSSTVLFFAIYICSMLHSDDEKKKKT